MLFDTQIIFLSSEFLIRLLKGILFTSIFIKFFFVICLFSTLYRVSQNCKDLYHRENFSWPKVVLKVFKACFLVGLA